jgi:tetratricopeptide (TPR) repeat protein
MARTPLPRAPPPPREEEEEKMEQHQGAKAEAEEEEDSDLPADHREHMRQRSRGLGFSTGDAIATTAPARGPFSSTPVGAGAHATGARAGPHPGVPAEPATDTPAAAWLASARREAAAGNVLAARHMFECAVAAAPPNDGRTWLAWARCEARVAEYTDVVRVLRRATDAVPNDPYLWHFWAQQAMRTRGGGVAGALKIARDILVRGAEHCPTSAALLSELAKLQVKASNYPEARRLYAEAVAVDPTDSHTYMDWANLERRSGRGRSARAIFTDGVKHVSRRDAAVLYTAFAQFEASDKHPDQARFLYGRAAEANPMDTYVWQTWGCFEEAEGNVERARQLFERGVVVTGGQIATVWQAWGMLEQRAGHPNVARHLFERGTRANPTDAATWVAWGRLEATAGNRVEARRLFEHAASQMDDRSAAGPLFLSWAQLEASTGNVDCACDLLRRAVDRASDTPSDTVRLLHTWAGLEWRAGRKNIAKSNFESALKLRPRDPKTAHAFARLKIEMGNYDGARVLLRAARRQAPSDPFVMSTLALLEWQHFPEDGGIERARNLFSNGARQNPNDATLIKAWATFESAQGDLELGKRLRDVANKWPRR